MKKPISNTSKVIKHLIHCCDGVGLTVGDYDKVIDTRPIQSYRYPSADPEYDREYAKKSGKRLLRFTGAPIAPKSDKPIAPTSITVYRKIHATGHYLNRLCRGLHIEEPDDPLMREAKADAEHRYSEVQPQAARILAADLPLIRFLKSLCGDDPEPRDVVRGKAADTANERDFTLSVFRTAATRQRLAVNAIEGKDKSTALLTLAGGPENFSDQTILGQGDRDQQEALRGVWLYEIADLSNIRKAEVEDVKAFASRTHDRARPAYGRFRVDLPRRGVIWATTNNSEYLKSQTGNRRFWPIEVAATKPIDIEGLTRDRDQLLAEACRLEAEGASIVLPKELWAAAGEQQEQRREADPWEDKLRSVEGVICEVGDQKEEERILSADLLSINIGIPIDRQKSQDLKRVGEAMRSLGWSGPKVLRIGEKLGRGYWRQAQALVT